MSHATMPDTRTRNVGGVMSNFDHEIDDIVARQLVAPDAYGKYPGWGFNAKVWIDNEHFHAEVWVYQEHVDTISALSLPALMEAVSNKYGWR